MLSVCPPQAPARPSSSVSAVHVGGLSGGQFTGTIQHLPFYSNDRRSMDGGPVTYQATLTLTPSGVQGGPPAPATSTSDRAAEPDLTERLDELRKNRRLKKKLAGLTSNPFFSKELFGDMFGSRRASNVTARAGRMRASEPMSYYPSRVTRHLEILADEEARQQSAAELEKAQARLEERKGVEDEMYCKEHVIYEQEIIDLQQPLIRKAAESRLQDDTSKARQDRERLEGEEEAIDALEVERRRLLREQQEAMEAVEAKGAVRHKHAAPVLETTGRYLEEQANRDADDILSYVCTAGPTHSVFWC